MANLTSSPKLFLLWINLYGPGKTTELSYLPKVLYKVKAVRENTE